ncbi:hypothetical protein GALL_426750 [mine drainage metagenome]|uniref:Lipopolysaccharide assembly protein A domain-containing protein n=1 Tax=mine drainage metagenome TaxID=410659 RepID=A0A1J5PVP9_9ZZZZ
MRLLSWFFRLVLFLLLFGLALNNLEPATLHLLFGAQWHAPMIVLLLVVFALGVVLGVLALLPSWMRHKRRGVRAADRTADTQAVASVPAADFSPTSIDRPIDGV